MCSERLVPLLELLTRCWELGFTVDHLKRFRAGDFHSVPQFSADEAEATARLISAADQGSAGDEPCPCADV